MIRLLRAAVFASGGGSNLQALLDHTREGTAAWKVALVVADRPGAGALGRAEREGVPQVVVDRASGTPELRARALIDALTQHEIDAVLLAGYLQLVPPSVVARFRDRIVNIHPALLPAFGGKGMYGMHVHRAVLEAGVRVTGPTVHLVDEVYDRGPIIAQWPVPVRNEDTPERLAARVLAVEHDLYPRAVDHLAGAWNSGGDPGPLDESGARFELRRDLAPVGAAQESVNTSTQGTT